MLENILNNVNSSQGINKATEAKKNIDNNDEKDDFKNLLKKNLLAQKSDSVDPKDPQKITDVSPKKDLEKKSAQPSDTLQNSHLSSVNTQKDLQNSQHFSTDPKNNLTSNSIQNTHKDLEKKSTQPNQTHQNNAFSSLDTQRSTPDSKNPNIQSPKNTPTQEQSIKDKKLSDIKTLGEQKNLQPKNLNIQSSSQDQKPSNAQEHQSQSIASSKDLPTQSILEQKIKTQTPSDKQTISKDEEEKPLSVILKTLDEVDKKELKARKKFNQEHKIEYKIEGKSEKIAIIERGTHLPKNIIADKLENKDIQPQTAPSKNQPLKEAISQAFIKEVKPKTSTAQDKTQDSKETSEKKNKKSGVVPKSTTPLNPNISNPATSPKTELKEQNIQLQNQEAIQQNNTQFSLSEKIKKKQNNQEVQKSKEKTEQSSTKEKDSAPSLGVGAARNDLIYKSASAKETIKNFAQNFKEEIKKFKPPMSKISLELHPEKLGKLELTIKQTGKNLQVSVVSNNQAIALFVQNQTELRQNLAMIGFSGVDLNFSSQEGSRKEQQESNNQKRNKNSLKQYQEVKNISQIPYDTMEITLPKYA